MKRWTRGVILYPFAAFVKGEEVVVIETAIKHTDISIGKTFFVMSISQRSAMHLAESAFGRQLGSLIRFGSVVPADKQDRCTKRCKSLLSDSVYHPKRRHQQTSFFPKGS